MNKERETIITAEQDSLAIYIKKIWNYRTLILVFAKRDLKVKYAQTILGLGWTIVQPLTGLFIFTFFFGLILKWNANGLPYSLYVLTGLLSWNYFNYIVFQGTSSVQDSAGIIKKIYFPKAVLPLSKVLVALVELFITFLLLIPLLIWYQQPLSWHIIFIPVVLFFNTLMGLAVVFITASLSYKIRDLMHLIPFVMYFGVWITPVFFTKDILPQQLNFVWYLNPMASIVEGWRWCLFTNWQYDIYFIPALMGSIILFIIGFYLFSKAENNFSDFA